jgi:hypothetical protein
MYTLTNYKQTGYGRYRVTLQDADGETYYGTTTNVEAIDAIREAGRDMKSNDDGTHKRLCDELAEAIAAQLGLNT